jgi:pyruvate dehydrogenase E2 component (dihydrolipoamide acetyltransferase)
VRALAGKAKAGTLAPEEFVGGSFTISNLGMFGVEHFKAVINKPQTCILAVSGTLDEARLSDEGVLSSVGKMAVTLSADERAVDNFVAAAWLKSFKGYIENPFLLHK